MKIMILLMLASFACGDEICFSQFEKKESSGSETIYAIFNSEGSLQTKYKVQLARLRCQCLENEIQASFERLTKNWFNYSRPVEVCVTGAVIKSNALIGLSGFYLKRE